MKTRDAVKMGINAYGDGVPRSSNPFPVSRKRERTGWYDGWDVARENDNTRKD